MCELHFYRCPCGRRWTAYKKLASCESSDLEARCPDNLCMHVGRARRPQKGECEACADIREALESMEDESEGEANRAGMLWTTAGDKSEKVRRTGDADLAQRG